MTWSLLVAAILLTPDGFDTREFAKICHARIGLQSQMHFTKNRGPFDAAAVEVHDKKGPGQRSVP